MLGPRSIGSQLYLPGTTYSHEFHSSVVNAFDEPVPVAQGAISGVNGIVVCAVIVCLATRIRIVG